MASSRNVYEFAVTIRIHRRTHRPVQNSLMNIYIYIFFVLNYHSKGYSLAQLHNLML